MVTYSPLIVSVISLHAMFTVYLLEIMLPQAVVRFS
jgi:hypothetical protein